MFSNKILLTALRTLPEQFVDDGTIWTTDGKDRVVVAHPNFAPQIYENGKWRALEFLEARRKFIDPIL